MHAKTLLIVGAGLFGLTVAERAAAAGVHVSIIDQRPHVGGNAHAEIDQQTGIEIHKYGAHIFHTSNESVWNYVNRFTKFTRYEHRVFTQHQGQVYPLPINLATINQFYRAAMSPDEARAFIAGKGATQADGDSFEQQAMRTLGPDLYHAFIRGYTAKQWQAEPKSLSASIFGRLPVRFNYDNRYFNDKYQGLPEPTFDGWLEAMVANPLIDVQLNTTFNRREASAYRLTVYTGAIDKYFNYSAGLLNWRTLDFEFERKSSPDYQGTPVMNFADESDPYTRIHEFKHFRPKLRTTETIIAREFSRIASTEDEPYYPVNATSDRLKLAAYKKKAGDEQRVLFGGRLGSYKYLDMHMAIASALAMFENEVAPRLGLQDFERIWSDGNHRYE